MPHQLSWSHILYLLPLNNVDEVNYYIKVTTQSNLSYRELRNKIKSNEYERLDDDAKLKLINNEKLEIRDLVPNPIVIKNSNNYETITEKVLQKIILRGYSFRFRFYFY